MCSPVLSCHWGWEVKSCEVPALGGFVFWGGRQTRQSPVLWSGELRQERIAFKPKAASEGGMVVRDGFPEEDVFELRFEGIEEGHSGRIQETTCDRYG